MSDPRWTPVLLALLAVVTAEYVVPRPGPALRASALGTGYVRVVIHRFVVTALLLAIVPLSCGKVSPELVGWLLALSAVSSILGLAKAPLYGETIPLGGQALWCLAGYIVGHGLTLAAFGWRWGPELGLGCVHTLTRFVPGYEAGTLAGTVNSGLLISAGYAYIARGGAEVVRAVLDTLSIGGKDVGQARIRIGQTVGYLERFLLLTFILVGEYGAIGFVLAAKSIARYAGITESREFAEYYLVGTLSSAAVAIAVGLLIATAM